MFYSADLTIPAGTLERAPATEELTLPPSVITAVHIVIPSGVAGRAFTTCHRGASQIFPTNPGAAITGDDHLVSWVEQYAVDDEPRTLELRGWSPGARFDHTLTWRFELQTLEDAEASRAMPSRVQRIYRALIGGS